MFPLRQFLGRFFPRRYFPDRAAGQGGGDVGQGTSQVCIEDVRVYPAVACTPSVYAAVDADPTVYPALAGTVTVGCPN